MNYIKLIRDIDSYGDVYEVSADEHYLWLVQEADSSSIVLDDDGVRRMVEVMTEYLKQKDTK